MADVALSAPRIEALAASWRFSDRRLRLLGVEVGRYSPFSLEGPPSLGLLRHRVHRRPRRHPAYDGDLSPNVTGLCR